MKISKTPLPPYYAVIFTSVKNINDNGYNEMALEMEKLVKIQDGFLGFESARSEIGITVSYWKDLESIATWKKNNSHQMAQKAGRLSWYKNYKVRIAKVERDYDFENMVSEG